MTIHKNIRKQLNIISRENIDTSLSSLCHLSSSKSVVGYFYLKKIFKQFRLHYFKYILKYILSTGNQKEIELINAPSKSFKFIFITWAFKRTLKKMVVLLTGIFQLIQIIKKKYFVDCNIYG